MAQRIFGADVEPDKFGSGKHGFRNEDVGQAATVVTVEFLDSVQEELCRAVEAYGTLDANVFDQLAGALRVIRAEHAIVNHEAKTPAGAYSGTFHAAAHTPAYGPIIVGTGGEIQSAGLTGGETWTKRTPDDSFAGTFRAAAAISSGADASYVIAGDGGMLQRANDGVTTWNTNGFTGSDTINALAVRRGGNLSESWFVAVGEDGTFFGLDYFDSFAPASYPFTSADLNAVAVNNGFAVAVGDSGAFARLFIDTNGIGSSTATGTIAGAGDLTAIEYVTGVGFVATSSAGIYVSADDGLTWTQVSTTDTFALVRCGTDGDILVGLNILGRIYARAGGLVKQSVFCGRDNFALTLRGGVYLEDERFLLMVGDSGSIRRTLRF
jgi:hypothetical protein